jgi:predicted transcriptional regulator of viral defense system
VSDVSAFARLRRLGKPVVTTDEAALCWRASPSAASHTLRRLEAAGLVQRVHHGLWAVDPPLDPLLLTEYLTAPLPSYVSLQSALHLHGMVSQVPEVIYLASLAQTRRVRTSVGTYSIHRLAPAFFGGFETDSRSGMHLATPEKALLDILYLAPARSRLFSHLPELELPDRFDVREARRWLDRIKPGPRRSAVARRLDKLVPTAS